jgi:hypothetical protein
MVSLWLVGALIALSSVFLEGRAVAQADGPPNQKIVLRAGRNISIARIPPPRATLAVAAGQRQANASIDVTYNGFPDDAKKAFEAAVKVWESVLTSSVPIKVKARWLALGDGILGQAGPTSYDQNFPNAPKPNTWYPIALANKCAGKDLKPDEYDIDAEFSSTFPFYFDLDQNTPRDKYDFMTVVLHELGHGLGFIGSAYLVGPNMAGLNFKGHPRVYDHFVVNALKKRLIDPDNFVNPSQGLKAQLTGNNLFFNGPTAIAAAVGSMPRIHAPSVFQADTSFSHLDENEFPPRDPNSLLTPILDFSEAIHSPGPIGIGILHDLGW